MYIKTSSFKKSKVEFQNLLDFFLLGHLKDYIYTEKPQMIEELTNVIFKRINRDSDFCQRDIDNIGHRIVACRERKRQPHGTSFVFFKIPKIISFNMEFFLDIGYF